MKELATTARTTTSEAVLGMLSLRPMTGYEIRQQIETSIGNFWSESFGQIYPTLAKLHKQGLVSAKAARKAGGKVYALTPKGRERLQHWLSEAPQPRKPRNELLLKLFFAANGDPARSREQVLERRTAILADLARYEEIKRRLKVEQARNPSLPFFLITLNYGLAEARAILAWTDQTVAALDHLTPTKPRHEETK